MHVPVPCAGGASCAGTSTGFPSLIPTGCFHRLKWGRDPPHSFLAGGLATGGQGSQAPHRTGFHDLRHYYASLLIRHGESVKTVQHRLGHATAAETLSTPRCGRATGPHRRRVRLQQAYEQRGQQGHRRRRRADGRWRPTSTPSGTASARPDIHPLWTNGARLCLPRVRFALEADQYPQTPQVRAMRRTSWPVSRTMANPCGFSVTAP
jgi:hypothetical protein